MSRHRYRRIVFFFARVILGIIVSDLLLPKIGFRKWAKRTRHDRFRAIARAFRELAIEMGGVLIKVGQFLSTRVDLLPAEITDELAHLQDEVPPEKYEDIKQVIEEEFEIPLLEKFAEFDSQPLAAASLGQVHKARIWAASGSDQEGMQDPISHDVVVKIQRPDIEKLIATDLAALFTVGNWLRKYSPINRRADVLALLDEFKKILYEEIDYLAEGKNAEIFADRFKSDATVRVPRVYWTHTTKKVLTLENVLAIKITDYSSITEVGIERSEVASRLLSVYLKQIFEDGFFHADPHPGNLFVYPLVKENEGEETEIIWQLTFVDFGMVGRVPPNTVRGLREMLIGVGTRDAKRLIKSYQTLGILLPSADLGLLEQAEENIFKRFWGMNMSELRNIDLKEMSEFAQEYRELLFSLPFQIPHDFIFLARTVAILSGMCTGLDPNFNVWEHIAPYAEDLLAKELRYEYTHWLDEARLLLRALLSIPVKLDTILEKLDRGEIMIQAPLVLQRVGILEHALNRVVLGIVFAVLLLSGVQLHSAGEDIYALPLLGVAGITFVLIFLSFIRRRRA